MARATTPGLDEFAALSVPQKRKQPCKLDLAAEGLSEADRKALRAACATETITVGGIVKWFERRDREVSISAVQHHRSGRCACGKR